MPPTDNQPQQNKQLPVQMSLMQELQTQKSYDSSIKKCTQIIKDIETLTKRRTITYFASTANGSPFSFINDDDSVMIEDILRTPSNLHGLDLILNSGGGYATSAERIINVCQTYVSRNDIKEFRVIVPRLAKSAATMVSLGADKIILCDNAELGPIDPQMALSDNQGRKFSKPGYLITKAVEKLLKDAKSIFPAKNEASLTFLRQYNYDIYATSLNELELSENIAKKILNRKKITYPNLTYDSFTIFTDPTKTLSHGRLIGIDDLKDSTLCSSGFICDLTSYFSTEGENKLTETDINKLSNLIWELYIRKTALLNDSGNPQIKIIEDNSFSLISGDPEWKAPINSSGSQA